MSDLRQKGGGFGVANESVLVSQMRPLALEDVFPIEIVTFQGIFVSFRGCISAHHDFLFLNLLGSCTPGALGLWDERQVHTTTTFF